MHAVPARGVGDGDHELLIALDGDLAGRSERRIAEDLFGRDEAAAHWSPDGWMRSMGIGGGAVSNLFLTLHGVPIHRAVSTSAGVRVLIAIPGTIGYILAGLGRTGLPPGTLGFVSLTAFALTVPTSLLTTPFGVALAHRLGRRTLELAFGGFLVLVALRFAYALVA